MEKYKYIGPAPELKGQTAWGTLDMMSDGRFVVQVDDKNHAWARGWHKTDKQEWERTSRDPLAP